MAHTLTAKEALSYYFKRRPAFVKDICYHVFFAKRNQGTDRKFHARHALNALVEPLRINSFLLQHVDTLALDNATRSALENDAADMRAYSDFMHACLRNPWA